MDAPEPLAGGVLALRPCALCERYVDARTGCRHWRPDKAPPAGSASRNVAYRERKREREKEARRRQRQREVDLRLQERAAADVAEFKRQMGLT